MYAGFEEIAVSEGEVLNDYNFSTEMKKAILDVVAISIQISTVNISADLGVRSFAPDGVEHVKSLLKSAEETANRFTEVNSKITTLGSPQYRINLEGRSYDEVLEVLDSIESELNTISKSLNVEYVIERKKN
jgi:translation initiation factor 2 subunit 1